MTSSFVCCALVAAAVGSGRVADLPRPLAPPDTSPPAQTSRTPGGVSGPVGLPTAPPDDVNPDLVADRERRECLDKLAAGFEPFDLSYLPCPAGDPPALVAVRPAALFAHPDLGRHAAVVDAVVGLWARSFVGVRDPVGPGLAEVEWLLLAGEPEIIVTATDYKFGGKSKGFAARTRTPYDWAGGDLPEGGSGVPADGVRGPGVRAGGEGGGARGRRVAGAARPTRPIL